MSKQKGQQEKEERPFRSRLPGLDPIGQLDMAGLDHSDGGPITEAMLEQRMRRLMDIASGDYPPRDREEEGPGRRINRGGPEHTGHGR